MCECWKYAFGSSHDFQIQSKKCSLDAAIATDRRRGVHLTSRLAHISIFVSVNDFCLYRLVSRVSFCPFQMVSVCVCVRPWKSGSTVSAQTYHNILKCSGKTFFCFTFHVPSCYIVIRILLCWHMRQDAITKSASKWNDERTRSRLTHACHSQLTSSNGNV